MEETKRSIGSSLNTENFEYFQEERFIYKGDTVYLFSDGYADQFGGEKGKKFKQRNFLQLLFSLRHESMQEQYALVKESFDVWRGEEFQVDDVCVMGIRF
jgi:serine phosphatase RsbU (regulator of sigma subunit)